MKAAKVIEVGAEPIARRETTHNQMSLAQMISYHEGRIVATQNNIKKMQEKIRLRRKLIKQLIESEHLTNSLSN